MNKKERRAKLRGRHSATNESAPKVVSKPRPFRLREIEPNPLYDQVAKQMGLDPLKGEFGFKKTDIWAGIRYRDTRVPIPGFNVPETPDEEL